jgi:dimethylglycine dehydrogenase
MALVPRALATEDMTAEIEIMGSRRKATRIPAPTFDADGARMRG